MNRLASVGEIEEVGSGLELLTLPHSKAAPISLDLDQGLPGFPRHTQRLDSSRRKPGSR
jgi:hypothetical protein